MPKSKTVLAQIVDEESSGLTKRQALLKRIEGLMDGRCVISFQMAFALIEDSDVDMIEDVLQVSDCTKGVCMVLNSHGGVGLAAERIVNVCRAYSSKDFWVAVPKMAKSAATLICMGASKILMGPASELGPIDPQFVLPGDKKGSERVIAADCYISKYEELMEKGEKTAGRVEVFLQQLSVFDPLLVEQMTREQELSVKVAVNLLKTGMMKNLEETKIEEKIELFTKARAAGAHARPIPPQLAVTSGLCVESLDVKSPLWQAIWELYRRTARFFSLQAAKVIESKDQHFHAPVMLQRREEENEAS